MSSILVSSDYNLSQIASNAGSTDTSYRDGSLHCNCDQASLDAALAAYDHNAYVRDSKIEYFTEKVQQHMDSEAARLGYDDIFTAVSYVTSTHPKYGPEGLAFRDWRDSVWTTCLGMVEAWLGGGPEPTLQEVYDALPVFTPPA